MKKIFLALLLVSVLVSCSKDDESSNQSERPVDIYAAGGVFPILENSRAVFWKNGEVTYLTDGTYEAYAYSVFVEQGNTHVVGFDGDAKYWKNGIEQNINGLTGHYFTKVQVINNKVYILGVDNNIVKLWIDGVPTIVTGIPGSYLNPCDFKVVGNDTYVLVGSNNKAFLWKNGTITVLTSGTALDTPRDLCVVGNDVYVLAEEADNNRRKIKYWKNGVVSYINNSSNNVSTFNFDVSNNKVYVGGTLDQKAYYWKNGVGTQVGSATGNSNNYGIQIVDGNVYTVNTDNGNVTFMKNSTQIFVDNISPYGEPNECFVVYR